MLALCSLVSYELGLLCIRLLLLTDADILIQSNVQKGNPEQTAWKEGKKTVNAVNTFIGKSSKWWIYPPLASAVCLY